MTYPFSNEPIDVVIPCARKDLSTLELCIEGIRKNGQNIRRIIVVSKEKLTDLAEWYDETNYPFSKEEIALEIFHGNSDLATHFLCHGNRSGWILQQLLKLYAPFVIPGISPNVLMLDSDVVFFRPVEFMNGSGNPHFAHGSEYHTPYFDHAARLLPGLKRVRPECSGVAHHMLFQRPVLEDLFSLIRLQHGVDPWRAICRCIDPKEATGSSFSEYEIYFNFIQLRSDQAIMRPLRWDLVRSRAALTGFAIHMRKFDFVCCPDWYRKN